MRSPSPTPTRTTPGVCVTARRAPSTPLPRRGQRSRTTPSSSIPSPLGRPKHLLGLEVEAFPLDHSLRAPAVGYRVGDGEVSLFYAPDIVYIRERAAALAGVRLYIGDGATMVRSMVRRRDEGLFGHTPMRTQLTWCEKEGVPRAVFTHCGTAIISGDEDEQTARLAALAEERGVTAAIAHDGMELTL